MSRVYELGQAAIVVKGAWSAATPYTPLDCVTNGGGSFICTTAHTNKQPGVASDWASYWVSATKRIKNIMANTTSGNTTVTFTFSDGTTSTIAYAASPVADSSVTTAKLANGAVTNEKTDFSNGFAPTGAIKLVKNVHYFDSVDNLPQAGNTGRLYFVKAQE